MAEGGHTYEFGPPRGGWPDFDEAGKRIRDEEALAPARPSQCPECFGDLAKPSRHCHETLTFP